MSTTDALLASAYRQKTLRTTNQEILHPYKKYDD